jgi:hypothetical protein
MTSVSLLNCYWPSPAHSLSASGLVEITDQEFCSLFFGQGRCSSFCVDAIFVAPFVFALHSRVNCFRSSPAQQFLVRSPTELMTIFYSLVALGAFETLPNHGPRHVFHNWESTITVAAQSKAWTVFTHLGSNPSQGMNVCIVCFYSVFVLFYVKVEWPCDGLISRPRSPTDCLCDQETEKVAKSQQMSVEP